jgi:hypothetical protein
MTMRQVTAYFRREADGAILTRTIETEADARVRVLIPAPLGSVEIGEDEAREVIEQHRAERDQMIARDRARREEMRARAYAQLVDLGLDGDLAGFLTGAAP